MTPNDLVIVACPICALPHASGEGGSGNTLGAIGWTDGYVDAPMWHPAIRLVRCDGCSALFWREDAEELDRIPYEALGRISDGPARAVAVVVEDFGDKPMDVTRALRAALPEMTGRQALMLAKGSTPQEVYRGDPPSCDALATALIAAGASVRPRGEDGWKGAPRLDRVTEPRELLEALEAGVAASDDARERELRIDLWHGINHVVRRGERVIPLPSSAINANLEALCALLRTEHPQERILRAEACRALRRWDEALDLLDVDFSDRLSSHAECVRALARRRITTLAKLP